MQFLLPFAAPSSLSLTMAMTGEHPSCRADTTDTFTLSAVDDILPTPSIVDGNDARCTTTIPNVDDSISYD